MSEPAVHILLLNWNGWCDTVECIESCRGLTYPNFRIIVVDNGSTDDSVAILRARFPEVVLVETGANLGFAGGNNAGIGHALAQGADYVWLLNNDTVVDPEALSQLVLAAENDKKAGMVGSKIVYHGNPTLIWHAGAVLDPSRPHRPFHLGLNQRDIGQFEEICETGYVTGCSLLARREMIDSVGMLDDELFLYFEDADWSARAKAAGWKLIYCPRSLVRHKVSLSSGGADSPTMLYYTARNRLYFVKRNFASKLANALVYDLFEHVLVNLKKCRFNLARHALRGIIDFLRGRAGQYQPKSVPAHRSHRERVS